MKKHLKITFICICAALTTACAPRFPRLPGLGRRRPPNSRVIVPSGHIPRAPKPKHQVIPKPPHPGAVWTPGIWKWNGRSHVWVPGVYKSHPGKGKKKGHSKGKKW